MAREWVAINPAQRSTDLEVSFNQERRLLFEEWIRGLSGPTTKRFLPYNIPAAFRLTGALDSRALELALREVIRRHAALRATFSPALQTNPTERRAALEKHARTGVPPSGFYKQSAHELCEFAIRNEALDNLDDEKSRAIIDAEMEASFDYQRTPLLKALLLRQDAETSLLLLTIHHLAADLWSLSILRQELSAIYAHFADNEPYRLPNLSIQYPDFCEWQQKEYPLSGEFDLSFDYWRKQWSEYAGNEPKLEDIHFALPKREGFAAATDRQVIALRPDELNRAEEIARRFKTTCHGVFLTALAVLLHAYTAKRHIVIWQFFANRIRPETQHLIGWFANPHAIGLKIDPDGMAADLLQEAKKLLLGSMTHQELPIPLLWRTLGQRLCHEGPRIIYESIRDLDTNDAPPLGGLSVNHAVLPTDLRGGINLRARLLQGENKSSLSIEYPKERFRAEDIQTMLADWRDTVAALADAPDSRISSLIRDKRR